MKRLIIITLIFFNSCTSEREVMDSWLGSTKHELILKFGLPDQSGSDGNGGEVVVYTASYFYGSNVWYKNRAFYLNSNGKVYRWLVKTTPQPPTVIMFR